MFSLICAWINHWVNNRESGDLIRHRGHCDVNVMVDSSSTGPHSTFKWPPLDTTSHIAQSSFSLHPVNTSVYMMGPFWLMHFGSQFKFDRKHVIPFQAIRPLHLYMTVLLSRHVQKCGGDYLIRILLWRKRNYHYVWSRRWEIPSSVYSQSIISRKGSEYYRFCEVLYNVLN